MKQNFFLKLLAIICLLAGCEQVKPMEDDAPTLIATTDYVDEYGINRGKGIAIGSAVWAPVNCGFHEADYPYGKLYQWGRKYGQGYDSSDAQEPSIYGPCVVTYEYGQSVENKDIFFVNNGQSTPLYKSASLIIEYVNTYFDWIYPQDDTLWNLGTEENPEKSTNNDPCPQGWRVPTYQELSSLKQNKSTWSTNNEGNRGYWFSGYTPYSEQATQLFLQAAGCRIYYDGLAHLRDEYGTYWSSSTRGKLVFRLHFESDYAYMGHDYRGVAAVRCVQE